MNYRKHHVRNYAVDELDGVPFGVGIEDSRFKELISYKGLRFHGIPKLELLEQQYMSDVQAREFFSKYARRISKYIMGNKDGYKSLFLERRVQVRLATKDYIVVSIEDVDEQFRTRL